MLCYKKLYINFFLYYLFFFLLYFSFKKYIIDISISEMKYRCKIRFFVIHNVLFYKYFCNYHFIRIVELDHFSSYIKKNSLQFFSKIIFYIQKGY